MGASGKIARLIKRLKSTFRKTDCTEISLGPLCILGRFTWKGVEGKLPLFIVIYGNICQAPDIQEKIRAEVPLTLKESKENPGYLFFGECMIPVRQAGGFEYIPRFSFMSMPDKVAFPKFQECLELQGKWILMVLVGGVCSLFLIDYATGDILDERTVSREEIYQCTFQNPEEITKGF